MDRLLILMGVVALVVAFASHHDAAAGQQSKESDPTYIKVEIKGRLSTGVVAIGGETTGTTITAAGATWDLDFAGNKELAAQAERYDGKMVLVTGTARVVPGVTRGPRVIVTVASMKLASP
jgi:hypothetical protein